MRAADLIVAAHSRAGGDISLSLRHDGDTARLEVSDRGAGIEAEDVPRVFGRFFRASHTSDAITAVLASAWRS